MDSKVSYYIRYWTKSGQKQLDCSEEQFNSIAKAREVLLFGIAFEQRIDLALENFVELEKKLLDMALRHAIFPGEIDTRLRYGRHITNRLLSNFMSSARLYIDQTCHAVSKLYGKNSNEKSQFEHYTNVEYDKSLGYRTFEALRNYSQHRGLPAHSISFSSKHEENEDGSLQIRNSVSFALNPKYLREDKKFKTSVLNQLEQVADKNGYVLLRPLLREYISGLARIHKATQYLLKPRFDEADAIFVDILNMIEGKTGERKSIVYVCKYFEGREFSELVKEEWIFERKEYERKNQSAEHIHSQYVGM